MSKTPVTKWSGIAGLALLTLVGCSKPAGQQTTFTTPEAAAEALVSAAERFDTGVLKEILGPEGIDIVVTEDAVQDRKQAARFAANARLKTQIVRDPQKPDVVTIAVGADAWPVPMPLLKEGGAWRFDSTTGREEVLFRRIGDNELDAIEICRGYVEAQHEYASQKRGGAPVNQYAQRVISTPGQQDGLAWQEADGIWQGPVGHGIAGFIAEGYSDKREPFHGYFFKILKGQGPAAPMGELDFVHKGVMIAGFGLVAAPSNYGVTGVKTFIVSHTGIVYEKDLGPDTLEQFRKMERYNPDPTWTAVKEP